MIEAQQMPRFVEHFAPGSDAFRVELYEGSRVRGSLSASPSLVREHELDLDDLNTYHKDLHRGGLLVARWILNAHDYGYETAHMCTASQKTLYAFSSFFGEAPFYAYDYYTGGNECPLPNLSPRAAAALLRSYEVSAEKGSVFARHKLSEGISARMALNDETLIARARQFTTHQP